MRISDWSSDVCSSDLNVENTHSTDPNDTDTDNDRLTDGAEVLKHKTDPLAKDTDRDRLSDGGEVLTWKTNPLSKDTDGDRRSDGAEKTEERREGKEGVSRLRSRWWAYN